MLLETEGHTGRNAQAHLERKRPGSASPPMSLCSTCLKAPSRACPVPSSIPLTCVFPLPGAPMSSVTSPVYSPESSSLSRLQVEYKVGSSTHLQAEWQGHWEAAVPRVPFPNADMCLRLCSFPPTPKLSPHCGKQQICSVGDTQGQSQAGEELWSWEQDLNTQHFSA